MQCTIQNSRDAMQFHIFEHYSRVPALMLFYSQMFKSNMKALLHKGNHDIKTIFFLVNMCYCKCKLCVKCLFIFICIFFSQPWNHLELRTGWIFKFLFQIPGQFHFFQDMFASNSRTFPGHFQDFSRTFLIFSNFQDKYFEIISSTVPHD